MTITEALAEIKTLTKRIAKKREFVDRYLWRQEGNKDPLEKDGGSPEVLRRERQAIADLEQRIVDIRRAITYANLATDISVNGTTRSIYDWLTWRREVADGQRGFVSRVQSRITQMRQDAAQQQIKVVEGRGENLTDVVVNVNEAELAEEAERLEEYLGTLDGLLSLKNATVTIDV